WVANKVNDAVADIRKAGSSGPVRIAVLGLSFKPDIDDLRESPAVQIAERLVSQHEDSVVIVEPNIGSLPPSLSKSSLVELSEALDVADLIVILVAHRQFAKVDERIRAGTCLVDVTGILSRVE